MNNIERMVCEVIMWLVAGIGMYSIISTIVDIIQIVRENKERKRKEAIYNKRFSDMEIVEIYNKLLRSGGDWITSKYTITEQYYIPYERVWDVIHQHLEDIDFDCVEMGR